MDALTSILRSPLIGIVRGVESALLPHILEAVSAGGLRNLEITMNSPGACDQIRHACAFGNGALTIGAGTVTSLDLLDQALNAGAVFIVTPTFNSHVLSACIQRQIPVFPGAFSPREVYEASALGATMVKIFPAENGGPRYLKSLCDEFPEVKLLPTGGVDLNTAPEFLAAGAAGLGVGSPLFAPQQIQSRNWNWLRSQTRSFVDLVQGL